MKYALGKLVTGAALAGLCWGGAAAQTIVVGGKAFTEQQIMTAMTVALLKAKGFTPDRKAGMGSAAVRAALEKEGGLSRVHGGLRREKSIDFLMARATISAA